MASILTFLVGLIMFFCAVWVIYSVVTKHKHWHIEIKAIWIVCAVLFNILTAIIYYYYGQHRK